ncbi:MAG: group III truncated hemoglobin [Saprospiraceae bacterium]|nr:group III truncated hemoglobin [Saprospiraceae bacterium]MDZ4703320.1 group III truncated hemoglobin [Saprospiraceae bacterium]
MKADIQNRADIETLVNTFYEKVKKDEAISYFFTEVIPVNWEHHLPIMYDFWENLLFATGNYEGNPMAKHKGIHRKSPLSMSHFQQWIRLFNETVNELFEGENAELIKQRAQSIATVMQVKIHNS